MRIVAIACNVVLLGFTVMVSLSGNCPLRKKGRAPRTIQIGL